MAKVYALPADVENWIGPRPKAPRSVGAHASVVVLSMLKAIAERKYGKWGSGGEREPQYEPGYLWEDILTAALAKSPPVVSGDEIYLTSQLEIVCGGGLGTVYGTPDRISWHVAGRRFIVDELKATWYSYRALKERPDGILELNKFDYWTMQAQTYAAMLHFGGYAFHQGGRVCRPELGADGQDPSVWLPDEPPLVRIGALFLNGTYRGDRATPYRCGIEWSEEELRTWWNQITAHAARMAAEKEKASAEPEPPAIQ